MRIGWFTPFADGTATAEFSARVVEALAALGHESVVMRLDERDRPARTLDREVVPWRFWMYLYDVDIVFYNVGDEFAEFAPVYDLIRRRSGIAILHDATMAGYFAAHAAARGAVEPPLDAAASLARIVNLASGSVRFGGMDEAVASGVGPVLHLPSADLPADEIAGRLAIFAEEVAAVESMVRLAGQIGDRLGDIGVAPDDPLIGRIGAATTSLFAAARGGSA